MKCKVSACVTGTFENVFLFLSGRFFPRRSTNLIEHMLAGSTCQKNCNTVLGTVSVLKAWALILQSNQLHFATVVPHSSFFSHFAPTNCFFLLHNSSLHILYIKHIHIHTQREGQNMFYHRPLAKSGLSLSMRYASILLNISANAVTSSAVSDCY